MLLHSDPAEKGGYLRFFYRDRRPTRLGRWWSRAYARLVGLGLLPQLLVSLHVGDAETGRSNGVVLVAAEYQGERYLVSMLGESARWVQNLRASGGRARLKRGGWQEVTLKEIPPAQRAPIIKAWVGIATSGRKHLGLEPDAPIECFEAIAKDYPVFRIDPAN